MIHDLVPSLDASPDDTGPCRDCLVGPECGPGKLACAAFSAFYEGEPRERWTAIERKPTRQRFERIFGKVEPFKPQATVAPAIFNGRRRRSRRRSTEGAGDQGRARQ